MTELDYLLIGHVTQDRFDSKYALGGTASYAAMTARNLGRRVGLLTSAAFEPGLVTELHGVQVARVPAEQTTRFVNTYTGGVRQQQVEAVAEPLTAEQLHYLPGWCEAPVVHLAPLVGELAPDIVDAFPRALLGVTPQGWLRAWGEDGLVRPVAWSGAERVLARADLVVLSEEDLLEPADAERYAALARLLVLTRGDRGCTVFSGGQARHVPAFQAKRTVDPTGAGDVFAAAFLVHLHETRDPFASADFASCVASFAVERRTFGGIPTLEQVQERWQQGRRRKQVGPAR